MRFTTVAIFWLKVLRGGSRIALGVMLCFGPALARDFHVDPAAGDDLNDGITRPKKTIPAAIKFAQPGDTIHLKPVVYRDYAGFYGKKGESGRPITLEGHGAILEGSDPIDPAAWSEVSPGLFQNANVLPRLDDAILGRWFFLWNGRMNHMGRTSKGRSAPFKKPEDLQPDEWTFVKDPSREQPPSKQIYGTFFIKLAPGRNLADANIRMPVRSAGVQMSGDNAHLVIRNLTATHPYNDGFNIHGDCRDVVFENIRAIDCGDDGISAHETAQYRVDGLVSTGNSTGICDTVAAGTSYHRVFIAGCTGFDLFFLDKGRYAITNAIVISSAQLALSTTGRDDGDCRLTLEQVFLRRLGETHEALIDARSTLTAMHCTFENLTFRTTGSANWQNCIINGTPVPDAASTGADLAAILDSFSEDMRRFAISHGVAPKS
jgi:hypothetical protein